MKYLLIVVLLFSSVTDPVTKIAKSNKLKREASLAYAEGNFQEAITSYQMLLDSMISYTHMITVSMLQSQLIRVAIP